VRVGRFAVTVVLSVFLVSPLKADGAVGDVILAEFARELSVWSITQTADGHMWFASNRGLCRFDGVQVLRPHGNHEYRSLSITPDGTLWAADDTGFISSFRGNQSQHQRIASGQTLHTFLFLDQRGELYATAGRRIWIEETQTFKEIAIPSGIEGNVNTVLPVDRSRWIWGTTVGLFESGPPGNTGKTDASLLWRGAVQSMVKDSTDSVFFASNGNGTLRLDLLSKTVLGVRTDGSDVLLWSSRSGLWAAGNGILIRGTTPKEDPLHPNLRLPSSTVRALTEDHEGSIWAATAQGVVQARQPQSVKFLGSDYGLQTMPFSVFETRSRAVWVSSADSVCEWVAGRFVSYRDRFKDWDIRAIAEGQEGVIYFGGMHSGLYQLEGGEVKPFLHQGVRLPGIRALQGIRDGHLWIGWMSGGLSKLHDGALTSIIRDDGSGRFSVRAMLEGVDGTLWIATSRAGLFQIQKDRVTAIPYHIGESDLELLGLAMDRQGMLWIGTDGDGLLGFDGEKFRTITRSNGLLDDHIHGLSVDDNDRLWMSTPRGLAYWSREERDAFFASTLPDKQIRTVSFGFDDGLQSLEAMKGFHPASISRQDGTLWFPTLRGIAVIDSTKIGGQKRLPRPSITEIRLGNRSIIDSTDAVATNDTLTVKFSAPSFLAPHRLRFRHRLLGNHDHWIESGDRSASYTGVAPGEYRFELQVFSADALDQVEQIVRRIALLAPWYRRTWSLVLWATLLVSLVYFSYRYRIMRLQAIHDRVLVERERIARDLHDTLEQDLAGLKLQIETAALYSKNQPERSVEHLHRATDLIAASGADVRTAIWGLRNASVSTREFKDAVFGRLDRSLRGGKVAFHVTSVGEQRPLPAPMATALMHLASEAVANALKHAEPGEIAVTLDLSHETTVVLTITDDGKGFDLEGLKTDGKHSGTGIQGMIRRIESLGGEIQVTSDNRGSTIRATIRTPRTS
jgi:signal transduction histidine kinase/ligand-binding sensor domain-containing protein